MTGKEKECIEYFHSSPVLDRMLRGYQKKYWSYGSFSGTVTLTFRTDEEREVLSGLMQKNYQGKKTATVSAAAFEKAIADTRFSGMSGRQILELYFHKKMTGKKEEKQEKERLWEHLLDALCCEGEAARLWTEMLRHQEEDRMGFQPYIKRRANERISSGNVGESIERDTKSVAELEVMAESATAREAVRLLNLGVTILSEFERKQQEQSAEFLPVFAARLTGNPHAFDDKKPDGHYLQMLVKWWSGYKGSTDNIGIFPAVQKKKQYLNAGIIRDEVSNYTMLCGVQVRKKNGELHQGMKGFDQEKEMIHVPLSVLTGWKEIECPDDCIYIVENPSIYAMLCESWKGERSVMCMNGQPRLSAVLMLDLLASSGITVYYGGDFDPEGLLIAQKIRQYYQGRFYFWNMSESDYHAARSEELISEKRLSMLKHIMDPDLKKVAAQIEKNKKAGYQENIWERYLDGMGE